MIFVRAIRALILVILLGAMLWLAGLLLFIERIKAQEPAITDANAAPVDAIVVLTGGSERVKTGIDLLNAGEGKKLLISGVHPGLTLDGALGNLPVKAELRACCIILGHAAESTEGNAEETQNWLELEGYRSLRLVTANYHMPRSLLLFHNLMPDMLIIPHPIAPESVKLDEWWKHAGTANLLIVEYNKYLWVDLLLRLGML